MAPLGRTIAATCEQARVARPYDQDMTRRKPLGTDWESWIDQVIREGRERGEFDDLPGAGRPLPGLDRPHDEMWWVRNKLESERVSYLPPALALRKDREDTLARVDTELSETRVRELLDGLNARIRDVNSHAIDGPPSTVMRVDIELLVQGWRERRAQAAPATGRPLEEQGAAEPAPGWAADDTDQTMKNQSSTRRTSRGRSRAGRLRWPRRKSAPPVERK